MPIFECGFCIESSFLGDRGRGKIVTIIEAMEEFDSWC